jgi:hypothetical protein
MVAGGGVGAAELVAPQAASQPVNAINNPKRNNLMAMLPRNHQDKKTYPNTLKNGYTEDTACTDFHRQKHFQIP